jgi:hypothetical protein
MDREWISKWRASRLIRDSRYREQLAGLPAGLETYWRNSAPQGYKGIRTDAFFFACAAEGLMNFFDAVRRSGGACALPSEAADSVWHAWLRWHPVGLGRFCIEHFQRTIPHIERTGLGPGALVGTLEACRDIELVPQRIKHLPALFRLDARLRMPAGHGYWQRWRGVAYARLDAHGRAAEQPLPHPGLTAAMLYAAGLMGREELASRLRHERTADSSSCTSDGFFAFAAAGSDGCTDSGSDSSACDSGSSCGSSCGGGD